MLGGATGGTTQDALVGENVAANAVTNNYLTHSMMNEVKDCLLGATCTSAEEKQKMIAKAEANSKELDAEMKSLCTANPSSDACRSAVNAATQYVAIVDAWNLMNSDAKRSSTELFDYIYNSPGAKENFLAYFNTIDNRADFFAATDQYEKDVGSGVKWFGGANDVSRAALTGLGADGYYSWLTFFFGSLAAGINAPDIYAWRATAGNTLMSNGFPNFKDLYNNGASDPVTWDVAQLRNEQQSLQAVHEQFLSNLSFFTDMSKFVTNTDIFGELVSGLSGGINILDYKSRVEYGCKILGYGEKQGCTP
jgi:filamentous hemagglutinin